MGTKRAAFKSFVPGQSYDRMEGLLLSLAAFILPVTVNM